MIERAINFLTEVGANLYDWTDDSKKIEIWIEIKDLGWAKKIIVIVKCGEREISRYMVTNANRHDTPYWFLKKKKGFKVISQKKNIRIEHSLLLLAR